MEQFVRLVVAGGVVLVASLWLMRVAAAWSALWVAGIALALVGTAALAAGIWRELDWRPSG